MIEFFVKFFFHFFFYVVHIVDFVDGVGLLEVFFGFGEFAELVVVFADDLELLFGHVFDIDEPVAGIFMGGDEFVELELDGEAVFILTFLDEENHEKGDDGGGGIDKYLPAGGEFKEGAADRPAEDETEGREDGGITAGGVGDAAGDGFEGGLLPWAGGGRGERAFFWRHTIEVNERGPRSFVALIIFSR